MKTSLMKPSHFCLLLFLCIMQQAAAQSPYTINIPDKETHPATGFLKMGANHSPDGSVLSYNSSYLIRNGEPWFPVMGEMHFSRCAEADWEPEILKMKAAGIQIISTYVFWIYSEQEEGYFNWTGNNNLHLFLSLCKKHGMYVWLRPGPFVHAELRNAGFPDWLLTKTKAVRTNDPVYLNYAEKWYDAIGQQCKGMLFKDGGPIIGVQIENELVFKKPELYDHMKRLKQIAINAGFDVPYYSAFSQGPDDQDEFLYTIGGYPDSPWAGHTKKMYKDSYFIKPLQADADIGSDRFGKADIKVRNTFPKLGAELGGGMQPTYHRRIDVSAKDIAASSFTKIANGINGMGYYMFHGGVNPVGKITLQETKTVGDPNDLPLMNYDFEAPIGAMGIVSGSYNELRLLNLFIDDFGSQLATESPFFPEKRVKSFYSADTVQASVRLKDDSGFIFLSNYQRFENLPQCQTFQLKLVSASGTDLIPAKPVTFPKNSYAIWPYNLNLHGAILHYATAQPLCISNDSTYVFFADSASEFAFQPGTVKQIESLANCKVGNNTVSVNRLENAAVAFSVISTIGRQNTIIVISREQALQTTKVKLAGKEVVISTDGVVTTDGKNIMVDKISATGDVNLQIYPCSGITLLDKGARVTPINSDSVFARYNIAPYKVLKGKVAVHSVPPVEDSVKANLYQDSLLHAYAALAGKRYNPLQPGPLYQLKFHALPGEQVYKVDYQTKQSEIVKNWIADVDYAGDVIAVYKGDKLVYDQFNYNDRIQFNLNGLLGEVNAFTLQILPVKPQYDIYVEDGMQVKRKMEWLSPAIKQITLTPEYQYKLALQ